MWSAITDHVSEFLLITVGTFLVHEVIWFVCNAPYLLFDHFKLFQQYKIDKKYVGDTVLKQNFMMLLRGHILQLLPTNIITYPLLKFVGFHASPELPSWSQILLQMIVFNIIEDAGFYWVHVWYGDARGVEFTRSTTRMHTKYAYTRFHRRHHEFVNVFSLTGEIAHPVEFLLNWLIPMMAGPFLMGWLQGTHIVTFWLWIYFRELRSTDAHSGYALPFHPLRAISFIYGGAESHYYHHSVEGRNYNLGGYKFWDWLMGTDGEFEEWVLHNRAERAERAKAKVQ